MKKTIGIFGSAFNPPTKGHENSFMQCINKVDEIWLIPSYAHAFGKKPISFEKRCEMLSIFLKNIKNAKVKISEVEKEYFEKNNVKYVYTYDLLVFLKDKYPEYNFKFICGEDNADPEVWYKFKDSEKIDSEFGKLVSKVKLDIRSTYVRENIQKGHYNKLKPFLFDNIIEHIQKNKFYK